MPSPPTASRLPRLPHPRPIPLRRRARSPKVHATARATMARSASARSKEKPDMNNLHRELAPISNAAWAQIEEEASRTLKRHLAARRVVDVQGPQGFEFAAVGTGHLRQITTPGDGIQAAARETKALVELRVPFELTRQAIDDVERGALDSDWAPLKDAARKIAFAEDRAVFDGYAAAGIEGIRRGSSNPALTLPSSVKGYPGVVAQAVSQLRLAG